MGCAAGPPRHPSVYHRAFPGYKPDSNAVCAGDAQRISKRPGWTRSGLGFGGYPSAAGSRAPIYGNKGAAEKQVSTSGTPSGRRARHRSSRAGCRRKRAAAHTQVFSAGAFKTAPAEKKGTAPHRLSLAAQQYSVLRPFRETARRPSPVPAGGRQYFTGFAIRYFLTMSATLNTIASSNSRRSRPVRRLIFSRRYTSVLR